MKYLLFIIAFGLLAASCEKRDYDIHGQPDLSNHYYAGYIPNNNALTSVTRNQTTLLKFPVQFYSSYTRDYDAIAFYGPVTKNITNPAVLGQDYNIVDKNGNIIPSSNGIYSIIFPQAKYAMDTIYIKLLNSSITGTRRVEIQLMDNKTDKYEVDTFSTAYTRPIDIK
ncbi:MAG: hypothetical protein JWN76_198 [Chitinophagaceae bacterium]|nr:hypothetical protein [Chitinophagaceae bacterium]